MGTRRSAVALVVLVVVAAATAPPASADDAIFYRPPVEDPAVDPFRPPKSAYGPGNRGLTYDLAPGTPVHAAAPGAVVFAGWVAGSRHVTVLHADGLRTSYSFLSSVSVRRGQDVDAGDVVGSAGAGFHLGVRDGDVYLDPATLFGAVEVRVRLVPHDEAPPNSPASLMRERVALAKTVREKGLLRRALEWGVDRASYEVERSIDTLRMVSRLDPLHALVDGTRTWLERRTHDCTSAAEPTPTSPGAGRVAVLVAGYGSTSQDAAIDDVDTSALGYHLADVIRYSYAGGRTPADSLDSALTAIPALPYTPSDTFGDLEAHGVALADLVEAAAAARPGAPIDLLAHSQGGVVTRLALAELQRRGTLGALGTVVTIGTPHHGADLGSAASIAGPLGRRFLDPLTQLTDGGVDADATSVAQMAVASSLVLELKREGVPADVDFRTIGAAGDIVVPGDRTTVAGEPSAMVGLAGIDAHDALPGAAATTRELSLALGGLPPGCRSLAQSLLDAYLPEAIGFAQNAALTGAVVALPG